MASDFRESLSSFGACLESGFGSGLSAFAFTMDVLLFLLRLLGVMLQCRQSNTHPAIRPGVQAPVSKEQDVRLLPHLEGHLVARKCPAMSYAQRWRGRAVSLG